MLRWPCISLKIIKDEDVRLATQDFRVHLVQERGKMNHNDDNDLPDHDTELGSQPNLLQTIPQISWHCRSTIFFAFLRTFTISITDPDLAKWHHCSHISHHSHYSSLFFLNIMKFLRYCFQFDNYYRIWLLFWQRSTFFHQTHYLVAPREDMWRWLMVM